MFAATNIAKNSGKSKYVHTGYGTPFDGVDLWSFSDDFDRNVVIFGVDNSLSYHIDNRKNNVLVLPKGPLISKVVLMLQNKNLVLTLVKQKQNFT